MSCWKANLLCSFQIVPSENAIPGRDPSGVLLPLTKTCESISFSGRDGRASIFMAWGDIVSNHETKFGFKHTRYMDIKTG